MFERVVRVLGEDVYKVYYVTPRWLPGTYSCEFMCDCEERSIIRHSTPLLYNIGKDPSEVKPLSVEEPHHKKIVDIVNEEVKSHRQQLVTVPSQFTVGRLLPLPWLQHCCNFPSCSCTDPVYSSGSAPHST